MRGEAVLGFVIRAKGFDEGDEVKKETGGRGGDCEVPPARAVVESGRKNGEGCKAVEEDGRSEPEQGHKERETAGARLCSV